MMRRTGPALSAGGLFALVALLALLPRLWRLDAQSLWLDEGSTWAEVTGRTGKGWLTTLAELAGPTAGYPLYHVLLRAWVALAGDSEWALRAPSALAGALACGALAAAAREWHPERRIDAAVWWVSALAIASPFALWQSQDAKAYSLAFAVGAAALWATIRAWRRPTPGAWLLAAFLALLALFAHRLALFALVGTALALGWRATGRWRMIWWAAAGTGALLGVFGVLAAAHATLSPPTPAGPLGGIGLTLVRFAYDRWPDELNGYLGLPAVVWLLPLALLLLSLLLSRDALPPRDDVAWLLLAGSALPLLALAAVQALSGIAEPRYATVALAPWLLLPALALRAARPLARRLAVAACAGMLLGGAAALLQPGHGLFSGDPVKEQWREATRLLARRVVPDDLVIVHPHYVAPLVDYYLPRVTPDPIAAPVTFPVFGLGDRGGATDLVAQQEFIRKRYDPFFRTQAHGRRRALLLIAPEHARRVDPPPTTADRYGWLGLRFAYPQRTWPCGGAEVLGVVLMCQSWPETFGAGDPPQPAGPPTASFGGELWLRGISLAPHAGGFRPGGTIPLTLYWQALAPPSHDYRVFLHLCRDCAQPPLANDDGPPLYGYGDAGRTSTWRVADPVHDERAVWLPDDLPPGRYTLLLGVYAVEGGQTRRLRIGGGAATLDGDRLVLGQITIDAP